MLVIPAIDLLDGKVVRLSQGIMEDATDYGHDPRDIALAFAAVGAKRIHIVDLNGARNNSDINHDIIKSIVAQSKDNLEIELGGGIRDMKRLDDVFNMGVTYAIIGTAAVKDVEFTRQAIEKYPNKIILGIDAKDGMVATEGWYEASEHTVMDVINMYKDLQVESVIYTDIARDGMLQGVNIESTIKLADSSPFPIVASGGVASIDDIKQLLEKNHKNLHGTIVGKAFYEGKMDLNLAFGLV